MNSEQYRENILTIIGMSKAQPGRTLAQLDLKLDSCEVINCGADGKDVKYHAEFIYEPKEEHLNPYGGVHGGFIGIVFDTALGMASASVVEKHIATTDMSVSYLRALWGNKFRVTCDYDHIGAHMIHGIGKMIDEKTGKVCATCLISYAILDIDEPGLQV
ncbi:MAG: PaaI family thioesterase [Firmicutes bacterium]|nr:PaaI family thioesterase [Bacillota bacterium]